jgi:hypothetical protein
LTWTYTKKMNSIQNIKLDVTGSGIRIAIGSAGGPVNLPKKTVTSNHTPHNEASQLLSPTCDQEICSADIEVVTSQDMEGIRTAITGAYQQHAELEDDLQSTKKSLFYSRFELALSYILIYGFFMRSHVMSIMEDIAAQSDAIETIESQLKRCRVNFDIKLAPDLQAKYDALVRSFKRLAGSKKIWDLTSSQYNDQVATRTAASSSVDRTQVFFELSGIDRIDTTTAALRLQNANGADIFIYPTFIAMQSASKRLAIIEYREISVEHFTVHFIEGSGVPSDSKIVGQSWYRCNKDGSPDRRFKENYQIPIAEYGQLEIKTAKGINEAYSFSNQDAAAKFAEAFANYQLAVQNLNYIPDTMIT